MSNAFYSGLVAGLNEEFEKMAFWGKKEHAAKEEERGAYRKAFGHESNTTANEKRIGLKKSMRNTKIKHAVGGAAGGAALAGLIATLSRKKAGMNKADIAAISALGGVAGLGVGAATGHVGTRRRAQLMKLRNKDARRRLTEEKWLTDRSDSDYALPKSSV